MTLRHLFISIFTILTLSGCSLLMSDSTRLGHKLEDLGCIENTPCELTCAMTPYVELIRNPEFEYTLYITPPSRESGPSIVEPTKIIEEACISLDCGPEVFCTIGLVQTGLNYDIGLCDSYLNCYTAYTQVPVYMPPGPI